MTSLVFFFVLLGSFQENPSELEIWQRIKDNNDTDSRVTAAYLHLWARNLGEAEERVRQILAQDPANEWAQLYLGNIHYWKGDLASARKSYAGLGEATLPNIRRDASQSLKDLQREERYQAGVAAKLSLSLTSGLCVILFLVVSPFLALRLLRQLRR